MGEFARRPHARVAGGGWLVRPGRMAAANDNAPARRRGVGVRRFVVRVLLVCLVVAAVLAVGGCGRRGAPQLPASAHDEPRVKHYPADPASGDVPNRKFVLDKILQ